MLVPRNFRGFTLTELAVVLVIITLLIGGLAMPLSSQRGLEQQRATTQALQDIRDALIGFALIHGRLPCPDTDTDPTQASYGIEETTCSDPLTSEGFLPWRTLGVAEYDAWGSPWTEAGSPRLGHWRYRIERKYGETTGLKDRILSTTPATAYSHDSLSIINTAGQALYENKERPIAIIYSLGPNNQADGQNASFEANASDNPTYQADQPRPDFDDQLIWLSRSALVNRLVAVGKLP